LRELVRIELLPTLNARTDAVDVAIRARREAYAASMDGLRADIGTIVERVGQRPTVGDPTASTLNELERRESTSVQPPPAETPD
jgi:hypothetical protein